MLPAQAHQQARAAARLMARAAAPSRRHSTSQAPATTTAASKRRPLPDDGRKLGDFVAASTTQSAQGSTVAAAAGLVGEVPQLMAYATELLQPAETRTFTIESYGCQMNSADSEVGGHRGTSSIIGWGLSPICSFHAVYRRSSEWG